VLEESSEVEKTAETLKSDGIANYTSGSWSISSAIEGKDGEYRVVFTTPESFIDKVTCEPRPVFIRMATEGKMCLLAIDEAHLIDSWRLFRPEYGCLARVGKHFPTVPLMALTATATPEIPRVARREGHCIWQ
jgi:superfamily II DNA helicase RecQ